MGSDARDADAPVVDRRRLLGMTAWAATVAAGGISTALRRRPVPRELDATTIAARAPQRIAPSAPPAAPAPSGAGPGSPATAAAPVVADSSLPLDPPGELTGDALVLHVVRRTTFGPTPELLAEVQRVGVDAWLEEQLAPDSLADPDLDAQLEGLGDLHRSPAELRARHRHRELAIADLRVAAVLRAVRGRRQLHEVMVDLWHDRFAASAGKGSVAWHLPEYDRAAIRPHALGRFSDLLRAVTRSGAMLEYLDTRTSRAPELNENHGRELLELHTVGRASGIGEVDVSSAARVLSGWTLDPPTLRTVFDPAGHDGRPATVLGWSTPGRAGDAGAADLDPLLVHLATHPATATRIAEALVQRFVADDPPAHLVASTAAAYLSAGTDLAATLRHLFATPEFRAGGAPIVRRPFDLFAAQLRALDAQLDLAGVVGRVLSPAPALGLLAAPLEEGIMAVDPLLEPLVGAVVPLRPVAASIGHVLVGSGHALFMAPTPAGFPLPGHRWSAGDALLRRWSLAATLAFDGLPGIVVEPERPAAAAGRAGAVVDELALRCFGAPASSATRAGALAVMGCDEDDPIGGPDVVRSALAFLLAAPEVQVR